MVAQQRQSLMRVLLPLLVGLGVLFLIPLELPVGLDLSQALLSARSVLNGGDIYGLGISGVSTDPQSFALIGSLPYPGPPWSFPPLVFLGLFTPERAAALWFILSVICLALSVTLVTAGLTNGVRVGIVISALVSAPVQGHLIVGQMTILALLGAALLAAGQRGAASRFMGVGVALLAFRPHLGLPVVLVCGLFLLRREPKDFFVAATYATAILLSSGIIAFVIDPKCLTAYSELMVGLNSLPSNKVCDTCSSLPVLLTDRSPYAPNSVWTQRFMVGGFVVLALGYPLIRWGRSLPIVVSGAVCVSLLSAAYNRNYDFVLLVVPLVIIARQAWALRACASRSASIALAFVATGVGIAGVLPYLVPRAVQGEILWLSALCGYGAALLVSRGESTPKRVI